MTGNKCLLDTNIIIRSFKERNEIVKRLDEFESVFVSVTVIGELFYGAYKSSNTTKHLNQIKKFLKNCIIIDIDAATSEFYGRVKTALYLKGKPIPGNDIWIAATALQHYLSLFTHDEHFKEIDTINFV